MKITLDTKGQRLHSERKPKQGNRKSLVRHAPGSVAYKPFFLGAGILPYVDGPSLVPWIPDVLPFHDARSSSAAISGEKALMLAVLEDAVGEYQRYRYIPGIRSARIWGEAEAWFRSADEQWPFSFINICHVLGLEPDYIRAGLFAERRAA